MAGGTDVPPRPAPTHPPTQTHRPPSLLKALYAQGAAEEAAEVEAEFRVAWSKSDINLTTSCF